MKPVPNIPYYPIDGRLNNLFYHIIEEEEKFAKRPRSRFNVSEIENTAWQIGEIAKSTFVTRCYNHFYGISDEENGIETDSAHTNLVIELVDRALSYNYGPDFGEPGSTWPRTIDGYTYREVIEAARQHDLPENIIGDIADNGDRDDAAKAIDEEAYLQEYNARFPARESVFAKKTMQLFYEMNAKSSATGRLLYAADKTAALIIALALDHVDRPPMVLNDAPCLSEKDRMEMKVCDYKEYVRKIGAYRCRGSEMWTIDSLRIRKILANYDDTGFFTAIVAMYTLMVHGRWYDWRKKDYKKNKP